MSISHNQVQVAIIVHINELPSRGTQRTMLLGKTLLRSKTKPAHVLVEIGRLARKY